MFYEKFEEKINNIENKIYKTMESMIKGNCKKEAYGIMENILQDIRNIKVMINDQNIKESSK